MIRRPTVYDVAQRAGVSIATVSFAFRQPERVRPATRAHVLQVARELGYVPSGNARALAGGRTGALGLFSFDLILPNPQGWRPSSSAEAGIDHSELTAGADFDAEADVRAYPLYVDEVQRGFELECWQNGYALLLSSGTGPDADQITDLAGRVDGLAVFPGPLPDDALDYLARHLPVTVISRPMSSAPVYHVNVDNAAGIGYVVDHLRHTHAIRSMEFVGSLTGADLRERFEAFRDRVRAAGMNCSDAPLDESDLTDADHLADLRARARQGSLPRALVCGNDQIALAVIDLLQNEGCRVPEDVAVTGFDGILAGRLSQPALTTVRQPMEAMGRRAARVLIESHGKLWHIPCGESFPVRFVPRHSCGCVLP